MAFHKAKALQEAEKSVTQGKISHAIKQYQDILANDPADVSLLNTIGDLYIRDRNMAEGLKQFHKLAEAFVREGFNVKAIAIYRKITKVDPNSVDTLLKLAELYQLQGLSREAREQYLQATEFFKKRNQADKAIETLRKLVQLDPENVNFRNRMAVECEQFGKKEEAGRAYLEAAEILLRHDDQAAAEAALKKAAAQDPKNSKVQFMRARLAVARHEPEEAVSILNATPELLEDPAGRRILLDSYLALHRLPDAKRLVLEVIQSHPTDFEPVAAVSGLLVEKGDIDEAYQMLAGVSDPLIAQHAAGPLLDALRRIWAAAPQHIQTLELMHRICERTADESSLPEVLEALGHAYEETGDLEKSEAAYLKLVEREPENENYRALFNDIQRKLGREIKPVDFSSKEIALTVDEPASKPAAVDSNQEAMVKEAFENSDLFSRYNLPDKAIAELDKVLQFYPDQADVHRRILEIARKGFPERAAQAAAQLARITSAQGDHDTAGKYHAIAATKGPLQDVQLPPAPASKLAPAPVAAAPVPVPAEAEIPLEFPLAAVSTEESVAAPAAPAPAEMSFDLTPPEAVAEPPAAPPPSVVPPVDHSMEMDLSGDLEAFGFAAPVETAPPPPPAPVVEPAAPQAFPPPLDEPTESTTHTEVYPLPTVELEPIVEHSHVEPDVPRTHEPLHEPTVLLEAIDEATLAATPEVTSHEAPLTPLEEIPAAHEVREPTVELEAPAENWTEPAAVQHEAIPADLDDSRIEVEFYLENGFIEEARQTLAALDEKYPTHHLVAELHQLYNARTAEAPVAEPAPVPAEPAAVEAVPEPVQAAPVEAEPVHAEAAQPEVAEHQEVRKEATAAEAPPAVAEPVAEAHAVAESVELELPEELQVEAPPAQVAPEVAHEPEPVVAETTPEVVHEAEPAAEAPVESTPPEPEVAHAHEPAHEEVMPVDAAHEEAVHQEAAPEAAVQKEVVHEDAAHEEWELPTSYAASPGAPAETEQPATAPAGEHEAAQHETDFSAPPHGQEFVIEDEQAAAGGGMDMLGDLAGDFASSLDGIAGGADEAPGATAAPTAKSTPAHDLRGGASHLDGLLAEMEEPGEAEMSAAKDDPETHYNLGVAFREMGLLDEAIGEFQKVVKGSGKTKFPPNFLQACSLLAICFMEKRMPMIAVKWYMRALETPGLDDEATLALHYDLGIAYEMAGDSRNALDRFTEVYSQNIDFRDVAEKIRELQQKA